MAPPTSPPANLRAWQLRIFWLLWGAYASYYLCRVNFAVAQPMMLREFPDWTAAQIGTIPSVYSLCYAVGQMVNGTLGQRWGARAMMTCALVVAAVTNLLFSRTSSFTVMLVLWGCNGYAQSAGWSLLVQTIANWNTSARRGTVVGLISTCYQVGNVASWLLAGTLCEAVGWRASFWVPSLLLVPMAIMSINTVSMMKPMPAFRVVFSAEVCVSAKLVSISYCQKTNKGADPRLHPCTSFHDISPRGNSVLPW